MSWKRITTIWSKQWKTLYRHGTTLNASSRVHLTTVTEGVAIRKATTEDKNSVLAINKHIYKGRDYLSAFYQDFIDCPQSTPFVAVLNENIVGFLATFVVDNGHTVIFRAARVKEELTGKGIIKKLHKHALASCDQKVHAFNIYTNISLMQKSDFKLANHRCILSRLKIEMKTCSEDDLSLPHSAMNVKVVSNEDLKAYFQASSLKKYLFPRDRILVHLVPFRLLSENIPLIQLNGSRTQMFSDVRQESHDQTKGLLSIGTTHTCLQQPHTTVLEIYGTDTTALEQHLVAHIEYIKHMTQSSILDVSMYIEPEFDIKIFTEVIMKLGLKFDKPRHQVSLYEGNLEYLKNM